MTSSHFNCSGDAIQVVAKCGMVTPLSLSENERDLSPILGGFCEEDDSMAWVSTRFVFWFLIWTLCEYMMHRFFHWNHPWNAFYRMHQFHHSLSLGQLTDEANRWPKPLYFLWFFDNIYETIEIVAGETVWALLIYWVDPKPGMVLLIFHYVYELLATDSLLEHNPTLEANYGLAVGKFHLEHHRVPLCNYGFTIDFWDRLFGTYRESRGRTYIAKAESQLDHESK